MLTFNKEGLRPLFHMKLSQIEEAREWANELVNLKKLKEVLILYPDSVPTLFDIPQVMRNVYGFPRSTLMALVDSSIKSTEQALTSLGVDVT